MIPKCVKEERGRQEGNESKAHISKKKKCKAMMVGVRVISFSYLPFLWPFNSLQYKFISETVLF